MGARQNKADSYGLKSKASVFVATSQVCVPQPTLAAPDATFRSSDFLALESPPQVSRDSKKLRHRRRSSCSIASDEGQKVVCVDIRKSNRRVQLRAGPQRTQSVSPPPSPMPQSVSPTPSPAPTPQRSFRNLLMTRMKSLPPCEPRVEFTADTNREAPYESIKYMRKSPANRSSRSIACFKLIKCRTRSNEDRAQLTQPGGTKDMMGLLKEAIDADLQSRNQKTRNPSAVKLLQTSPPRKEPDREKKAREVVKKSARTTPYVQRSRNAFVIQPIISPKAEVNPSSRAEHQWRWKGRYSNSPKSVTKTVV